MRIRKDEEREWGNGRIKQGRKGLVKQVEAVAFIHFTPRSILRMKLQKLDDDLTESVGSPSMRFVERGGRTILELVGRNVTGETGRRNNGENDGSSKMMKEDTRSLPGCTEEG